MNSQKSLSLKVMLTLLVFAGVAGAVVQVVRIRIGAAPFVLAYTITITLVLLGAVVLGFGIWLRLRLKAKIRKPVNPFQAVRILATARAAQLTGCAFFGVSAGLLFGFVTREIWPQDDVWVPTFFGLIGAFVLGVCGKITELMCRVPPGDTSEDGDDPPSPLARHDAVLGCDEKP